MGVRRVATEVVAEMAHPRPLAVAHGTGEVEAQIAAFFVLSDCPANARSIHRVEDEIVSLAVESVGTERRFDVSQEASCRPRLRVTLVTQRGIRRRSVGEVQVAKSCRKQKTWFGLNRD